VTKELKRWTVMEVLNWAHKDLEAKGIEKARLDAEVLLGNTLNMERLQLYTNFDRPLSQEERTSFKNAIIERRKRIPIAYITGEKEFYSRPFFVSKDVLIPRPETEMLIDEVISFYKAGDFPDFKVVDAGTGSGCIAITIAIEIPNARVFATDISENALAIARKNAKNMNTPIDFREGNLLSPLDKDMTFNCIVSNPPYIETDVISNLSEEVKSEPFLALDGGEDGLNIIEELIEQSSSRLTENGKLLIEIGYNQGEALLGLFSKNPCFHDCRILKDYSGHDRIASAIYRKA
jgi:release factor glutamine methyltransferase